MLSFFLYFWAFWCSISILHVFCNFTQIRSAGSLESMTAELFNVPKVPHSDLIYESDHFGVWIRTWSMFSSQAYYQIAIQMYKSPDWYSVEQTDEETGSGCRFVVTQRADLGMTSCCFYNRLTPQLLAGNARAILTTRLKNGCVCLNKLCYHEDRDWNDNEPTSDDTKDTDQVDRESSVLHKTIE